jgi:hypothetical protein
MPRSTMSREIEDWLIDWLIDWLVFNVKWDVCVFFLLLLLPNTDSIEQVEDCQV